MSSDAAEIPPKRRVYAYLLMGAAILIWASAFAGIRVALRELDALLLTAVRLVLGTLVLGGIGALVGITLPARRDIPTIVVAGLSGFTLYHFLLNQGLTEVTAGQASFIIATTPIWTAFLAWRLLGERISSWGGIGLLLSLAGVAAMSLSRHDIPMGLGALLVLGAAVCAAINIVSQKRLLMRYRPLDVTVHVMTAGSLPMLAVIPQNLEQLQQLSSSVWGVIVYLALGPIALGYYLGTIALGILPAYRNAQLLLLIPPLAALIAWVWIEETPGITLWVGGAMIVVGVLLGERRGARRA